MSHLNLASILNLRMILDFLKDAKQLKKLVMSNNSFSNVNAEVFSHLKQLHEVDFSMNSFTKISAEVS